MSPSRVPPRRWRRALATALAAAGLAASVGLAPVQASSVPLTPVSQASTAQAPAYEERRGNPKAFKFYRFGRKVVRWNRCGAIGFRVYAKGIPRRGIANAQEAMKRINRASGLRFRYRGTTRAKPDQSGEGYPRGTDLVIGWVPKRGVGGAAGFGGWQANGKAHITSGFVKLNRSLKLRPGFGPGPQFGPQGTLGQLIMHEAGHAVGLDHVRNTPQIMYPQMRRRPATWGAGDFNGLKRLGRLRTCR